MYLINAARGVSASLDAIAALLGVLKDFTVRLTVYNREDLSHELREKLTEILTTVMEILAWSTKVIKEGVLNRLKLFGKNLLLGNDTAMVRIDEYKRARHPLTSIHSKV
jgi:predicted RNase H-like nuclease